MAVNVLQLQRFSRSPSVGFCLCVHLSWTRSKVADGLVAISKATDFRMSGVKIIFKKLTKKFKNIL
jgi:hypothetical protein